MRNHRTTRRRTFSVSEARSAWGNRPSRQLSSAGGFAFAPPCKGQALPSPSLVKIALPYCPAAVSSTCVPSSAASLIFASGTVTTLFRGESLSISNLAKFRASIVRRK